VNRESAHSPHGIEALPFAGAVGAEVRCGAVQRLDGAAFQDIYQAWLDHLVLVFHDQQLTNEELVGFASRFGPLKHASVTAAGLSPADGALPDIHVVSNVVENGAPIGILGDGLVGWHSDMSAFEYPPTASFLYAVEVPRQGGDTWFNNTYLAYDTLDEDTKRRLAGLTIKHEVMLDSCGPGTGTGASHPAVCTHPETGSNMLFLGARGNTSINELPRKESDDLLDSLWRHATKLEFGWCQRWRIGDLLVWDNRCLLHCREPFNPQERRVLHRTQIEGVLLPCGATDAMSRPPHPRGRQVLEAYRRDFAAPVRP
jgi:taurine dioxygenase